MGEHRDYDEQNSFKPDKDHGITPEGAERMMKKVGEARRRWVCQGKLGTTFSPAVTQDNLLDIGQEILVDIRNKFDARNLEN